MTSDSRVSREPDSGALDQVGGASRPWSAASGSEDFSLTLFDVVRDLRRDVAAVELPLPIAGAERASASGKRLLNQLDEHLLPRLKKLSSPAIVVIAGSTGAGKSTLFNTLLSEEVSSAGVLRPTTRQPVLAYNPNDAEVVVTGPAVSSARLVYHPQVPRGIGLLDAPDLDSLVAENREIAQRLLDAADLWLFVTTANRYGDALPWEALERAAKRGASVAMVLNRVSGESLTTIRGDLLERLRNRGMTDVPLFVIPDVGPLEGLLDPGSVTPICRWLTLLAGPERSRSVIVRTLKGSLSALPGWVTSLADAVDAQVVAAERIRALVEAQRSAAIAQIHAAVESGVVASTTTAARWRELIASVRLERVKVKSGRARATRRAGRRRELGLRLLCGDVEAVVTRTLIALGSTIEQDLRTALQGPDLPDRAAELMPRAQTCASAREAAVQRFVREWIAGADQVVMSPTSNARKSATKAFGPVGLATLHLAAAAGMDDAERLLARVLPTEHQSQISKLRADLAGCVETLVGTEFDAVLAILRHPAFDADAAAGLRVRLAELRRLT